MKIKKAKKCAWRGRYLYTDSRKQLARITIDPNNGIQPALRVALPVWVYRSCGNGLMPSLREFRIPLPRISWAWVAWACHRKDPVSKAWLGLYRLFQWFWHRVDGRYGWGSEA